MKFGVVSLEGVSLWAAARMADEGHDVIMYHAPPIENPMASPPARHAGEGIIPLATTWPAFMAARPDIVFFDCSDYGKRADTLRRSGIAVFGSCEYYDRMEKDREFGIELAKRIGIDVPEYHTFSTLSASMSWLADRPADEKWYFKTDRELGASFTAGGQRESLLARLRWVRGHKGDRIKHILQKGIVGADLMTAAYFNGHTFLLPYEGTLERKEFGNDETGPKTGCAANVVWMYPDVPRIALDLHFEALAADLREHNCPPGIIDCNVVVEFDSGKPFFLEWTPRLGIDSEPTASRLLVGEYAEFIARLCEATHPMAPFSLGNAAYAIRLSVPPYPYEVEDRQLDERHSPIGLELLGVEGSLWGQSPRERFVAYGVRLGDHGYECSDPHGLLGISSTTGNNLEAMNKAVVRYARDLDIADLGYRTDGEIALQKDLAAVRRAGYPVPLL